MDVERQQTIAEVTHLKACINDVIGVVALPAIWSVGGPSEIVRTVLDVLLGMLDLDLVYVRLTDRVGKAPIERVRVAPSRPLTTRPHEIGAVLHDWLGDDPQQWPPLVRHPLGDGDMSLVSVRLGLQGDLGVLVAGSQRADFPGQTEHLLLRVAANQAAVGLQEARLLREQQRVATEIEQRVAQRTTALAAANAALTKEIAERRLAEERLRHEERELKRSEAQLAETQRLSATGSFSWHVATDELTWSAQLYRIFQLDRATPVTFGLIATRLHPDDVLAFQEQRARAQRRPRGGLQVPAAAAGPLGTEAAPVRRNA
jgi:PAS domain-containing protein